MQKMFATIKNKKKYILTMLMVAMVVVVATAAPAQAAVDWIDFVRNPGAAILELAFNAIHQLLMDISCGLFNFGVDFWNAFVDVTVGLLAINPATNTEYLYGAWGWVKAITTIMVGVGNALAIIYFLSALAKDALEYGNNFDIHHIIKRIAILALTMGLIGKFTSWVPMVFDGSIGLVNKIAEADSNGSTVETYCQNLHLPSIEILGDTDKWKNKVEEIGGNPNVEMLGEKDENNEDKTVNLALMDNDNNTMYICGAIVDDGGNGSISNTFIVTFLVAAIGALIMAVEGLLLVFDVISRWFKIFMILPLAPVALAGYTSPAGSAARGTANAWVKNFLGYIFEIVVMVIALGIGAKIGPNMLSQGGLGLNSFLFRMFSMVLVVMATRKMVGAAEGTLHHSMGI